MGCYVSFEVFSYYNIYYIIETVAIGIKILSNGSMWLATRE